MIPLDFLKRELKVGQVVLKVTVHCSTPRFERKKVTKVDAGKVYLDGWHQPVQYNDRLVILEDTPAGVFGGLDVGYVAEELENSADLYDCNQEQGRRDDCLKQAAILRRSAGVDYSEAPR